MMVLSEFNDSLAFTSPVCSTKRSPTSAGVSVYSLKDRNASQKPLYMISNLFGTDNNPPSLPRDVKDAVAKCREATQAALQDRVSRMDIEFPVGTQFGVEPRPKRKQADTPTRTDLQVSDRELARIYVEMFQPVGAENICVVFTDASQAEAAQKKWKGDLAAGCRILSVDRRKSTASKKKKKNKGFAAKLAAEIDDDVGGPFALPDNAEVALFVSPGPKEVPTIERICNAVGMGTLVVLLNARIDSMSNFGSDATRELFFDEFETVFRLSAAPQDVSPGCLMYRTFNTPWVLARKAKVGPPKTILAQESKPTAEECERAFDNLKLSDMERNVENALENVANWFR